MLKGKCALITGSVGGLGLAAAKQFAAAGSDIVLSGFSDPENIAGIRSEIEETYHVRTFYSGADLRRPAEIEQIFRDIKVDILINNAVVRRAAPVEGFPVSA